MRGREDQRAAASAATVRTLTTNPVTAARVAAARMSPNPPGTSSKASVLRTSTRSGSATRAGIATGSSPSST
jgi:hypothetical protein